MWAAESGSIEYDDAISRRLEDVWQALQRCEKLPLFLDTDSRRFEFKLLAIVCQDRLGTNMHEGNLRAKSVSASLRARRDEPNAQRDARHVDIGGGRHADLVRLRQVVTAQPHRTRRIRRVG